MKSVREAGEEILEFPKKQRRLTTPVIALRADTEN